MPKDLSDVSIDRHTAVALVLAKVAAGITLSRAIRQVSKTHVLCLSGRILRPSVRTLQRWIASYEKDGIDGLAPKPRQRIRASQVLSDNFILHLVKTKTCDQDASIPEVIRQAKVLGIVPSNHKVSRVSTWRAAKRLNLPIFATKGLKNQHMMRFGYAHRMLMNLSDGKHFRAGIKSRRRVVISFIDDATRFLLAAVVGKSETSSLFLRCLWKLILRWGIPEAIFLDNGSAFISKDVAIICARLDIALIFGTEGYPEGHGKIERYHLTLQQGLLRTFRGNPEIDADCASLELRIEHYNNNIYNREGHESLENIPPETKFLSDKRPLSPIADPERIRQYFIITIRRRVSRDNIVNIKGIHYEMPFGYAGTMVDIDRHLLDKTCSVLHEGKMVVLHRVNLELNAGLRRRPLRSPKKSQVYVPVRTAATIAFNKDHKPIVGKSGDFHEKE